MEVYHSILGHMRERSHFLNTPMLSLLLVAKQHTRNLDGFAEAHVVTEDRAAALGKVLIQEAHAVLLVRP